MDRPEKTSPNPVLTCAERQMCHWPTPRVHLPPERLQEPGHLERDPLLLSSAFLARLAKSPAWPLAPGHLLQRSPQSTSWPEAPLEVPGCRAVAWGSHCRELPTSVVSRLPGSCGSRLAARVRLCLWSQVLGECTEISPSASLPSASWATCGHQT